MTTLTEIQTMQTEYELATKDPIQRILYRLDHEETLGGGRLRRLDQFCILGLFADESGIGEWEKCKHGDVFYDYIIGDSKLTADLNEVLVKFYNLKDQTGLFKIADLDSQEIKVFLNTELYNGDYKPAISSLMHINDNMIDRGYTVKEINGILAAIIRSGVIFREE